MSTNGTAKIAQSLSSTIRLNDGHDMPMFGLGVFKMGPGPDGPTEQAVTHALKNGYRMIDTATFFGNQEDVAEAVKRSGLKREDVFLVTKLWENGYESCKEEAIASVMLLDTDYIDLYLIHSPSPGRVVESYKAMLELQQQGMLKSLGVSNFDIHHLEGMKRAGLPAPAVNQVELHPWMKRTELVSYCRENDIAVMGCAPLTQGKWLDDPTLVSVAENVGKTVGQTLVRYSVQMGYITIPKSERPERILENSQVFDWSIPEQEMARLNDLPEKSCAWTAILSNWRG